MANAKNGPLDKGPEETPYGNDTRMVLAAALRRSELSSKRIEGGLSPEEEAEYSDIARRIHDRAEEIRNQ